MKIHTAVFLAIAAPAVANVVETPVTYALPDGTEARGVLIRDPDFADEARAGVLVVPEWWGLNEFAMRRGREIAERGYVVFVADMYGNGTVVDTPEEAGRLAGTAQRKGLDKLASPALQVLDDNVEGPLFAIGFCFGGTTVVRMAGGDDADMLAGVVSFHGTLGEDDIPDGEWNGPPMLVLHGGTDPLVPPDMFAGFVQKALKSEAEVKILSFPGVLHAYTNPDADDVRDRFEAMQDAVAYDPRATVLSFRAMHDFFETRLEDMRGALLDDPAFGAELEVE